MTDLHERPPAEVSIGPTRGRPDASMSLITDLFRYPVDEGYAEAAAERARTGERPPRRWWLPLLTLVLVGLLLAAAGIQVRRNADLVSTERQELIDRIDASTAANDELDGQAHALEAEINELQTSQLELAAVGQAQAEDLQELRAEVGTVAVRGPGVLITLNNAEGGDPTPEDSYDPSLVSDIDIQQVVNGLWQAGAEGVSINGQRLTSLSAIRSTRTVVRVNYRPLTPPFEISAIGDPRTLAAKFGDTSGGAWLQLLEGEYGIQYKVQNKDTIELPAATVTLRHVDEKETK